MAYVEIAEVGELAANEMKAIEVEGKRLLLVYAQGQYYVVDEMCSHEDYSLALGCIKDKRIKCSLHGSYFDLDTGEALDEPADEPIGSYAVKISDNKIYVDPKIKRKSWG
jgi:3-phenylpropionate/trans-cinnamate dioxygenase ferredoxin subunit